MAATLLKLFVLSICLNTFLYLGVNYAIHEGNLPSQSPDMQDDIFFLLLEDRDAFRNETDIYVASLNNEDNFTATYKFELKKGLTPDGQGGFADTPDQDVGSNADSAATTIGFLDGLRMIIAVVNTIWRIALSPLLLFTYEGLPIFVALIIGLPLVSLQVIAIIVLIRGGGAT